MKAFLCNVAVFTAASLLSFSVQAQGTSGTTPGSSTGANVITTAPDQAISMPNPALVGMKIGYTNVQYLLAASPQTKVIKSQLESASRQYEKAIQDKMKDLEEKFAVYQKSEATMMESIKQDKQNELRTLESSIRTLQENASTELKAKENDLVKPELDKIYTAITETAKANAFTFVLNSEQVILYAAEQNDITTLVLKRLGYPEPKDEPETSAKSGNNTTPAPAKSPAASSGRPTPPKPKGKK
jgi:outer membrane protein